MYIPYVIETVGRSSKVIDLPSKLFQNRIIYFTGDLDQDSANSIIIQLLTLDYQDPKKPIDFYINSCGGSVTDGFAIRDCMENIKAKVNTIGIGLCASMGAYLVAAGTGKRSATARTRFLVHSVSSQLGYQKVQDLKSHITETEDLLGIIKSDFIKFSGGKLDETKVTKLTDSETYFDAETAIEYGLIDRTI